jgi:hypothetical protein
LERKIIEQVTSDTDVLLEDKLTGKVIKISLKFANSFFRELNIKPSKSDNDIDYYHFWYIFKENMVMITPQYIVNQECKFKPNEAFGGKMCFALERPWVKERLPIWDPIEMNDQALLTGLFDLNIYL